MEDDYFGKYTLSSETIEKLKIIKDALQGSTESSNYIWRSLFHVEEDFDNRTNANEDVLMESVDESSEKSQLPEIHDTELPSTQFYFTQTKPRENRRSSSTQSTMRSISHIVKSLFHTLEEKYLESEDMNDLTDANAIEIVENLAKKLSSMGCYNFCCSICNMETGLGTYYARIMCSNLLVQKILQLEKNSDPIETSIVMKIAEKFPDEVSKYLLGPLWNTNLKSSHVILTLIKDYSPSKKKELIPDFVEVAEELKPWQLPILQSLMDTQLEEDVKTKVLALLVDKALTYAKDNIYSQLILSFLKTQSPFTNVQRNMLHEIIIVHKTLYAKPMQHMFKKMFLHRDLWHIS